MTLHRLIWALALLSTTLWVAGARADCPSSADRACISAEIAASAKDVTEVSWRDQTYRDLATSLTYDNRVDDAIALIPQIKNPDTQAMTIRAIGMAAALYGKRTPDALKQIFTKLASATALIQQPDANAIAHTYIAMSQAFAGLDDDAWATASGMENLALKHKAFGETAEIQAERGDIEKSMKSIALIDAASYRNKSYATVAGILIKAAKYDDALRAAQAIDNPMKRAQTLQEILKAQEEKTRGPRNDKARTQ